LRIANIQDTLVKIDLVQRMNEALLSQTRFAQAEAEPNSFEHTRIRQERLDQPEETREANIREQEKKRKEPYLSIKRQRAANAAKSGEGEAPADGHIIDIKA